MMTEDTCDMHNMSPHDHHELQQAPSGSFGNLQVRLVLGPSDVIEWAAPAE
jgi:hypothetical protein